MYFFTTVSFVLGQLWIGFSPLSFSYIIHDFHLLVSKASFTLVSSCLFISSSRRTFSYLIEFFMEIQTNLLTSHQTFRKRSMVTIMKREALSFYSTLFNIRFGMVPVFISDANRRKSIFSCNELQKFWKKMLSRYVLPSTTIFNRVWFKLIKLKSF